MKYVAITLKVEDNKLDDVERIIYRALGQVRGVKDITFSIVK